MFKKILAVSLPVFALAAGCYQQNLRLAVHEDGAGTIRIKERIAPEATELLLANASEAQKEDKMHGFLVEELASWDGVCAWTDAFTYTKDGSIVFEAKGWFEDVRRIERNGPDGLAQRFDFRREADGTTLEWTLAAPGTRPMTAGACRAIAARFKGTVIEATVVMPGSLVRVDGIGEEENACGTWTLFSGPDLATDLRALEARKASEEELVLAVTARFNHTIAARYETKEPTAAKIAFKRELERAKATFGTTDLWKEIDRARKGRIPMDDGTAAR